MNTIFWIILGGAGGALLRYALGRLTMKLGATMFPFGTLSANLLACFLLGFIAEWHMQVPQRIDLWYLPLAVGFLGALSTFSTFSFEVLTLWRTQERQRSVFYGLGSVLIGCLFFWFGLLCGVFVFEGEKILFR